MIRARGSGIYGCPQTSNYTQQGGCVNTLLVGGILRQLALGARDLASTRSWCGHDRSWYAGICINSVLVRGLSRQLCLGAKISASTRYWFCKTVMIVHNDFLFVSFFGACNQSAQAKCLQCRLQYALQYAILCCLLPLVQHAKLSGEGAVIGY